MDSHSFKPEFQYLDIYPHHFWTPVTDTTDKETNERTDGRRDT